MKLSTLDLANKHNETRDEDIGVYIADSIKICRYVSELREELLICALRFWQGPDKWMDHQFLVRILEGLEIPKSATHYRVPCDCECHTPGITMMHMVACCDDGFINIPIKWTRDLNKYSPSKNEVIKENHDLKIALIQSVHFLINPNEAGAGGHIRAVCDLCNIEPPEHL